MTLDFPDPAGLLSSQGRCRWQVEPVEGAYFRQCRGVEGGPLGSLGNQNLDTPAGLGTWQAARSKALRSDSTDPYSDRLELVVLRWQTGEEIPLGLGQAAVRAGEVLSSVHQGEAVAVVPFH